MTAPSKISVGFVSLGCPKNLVDAQYMADILRADGFTLAPAPETADVAIINTCAFIGPAREEALAALRTAIGWKKQGPCRAVIATGCLPQRSAAETAALLPEVDAWLGVDGLDEIARVVRKALAGEHGRIEVTPQATRLFNPKSNGVIFSSGAYAYLKIAEGCNHACGFCAIPLIRGRQRSRPVAEIVREAESRLAAGMRELTLIAQDVTSYGRDLGAPQPDLCTLLRELEGLGGKFWIRLLYGYPSRITPQLLDLMAGSSRICAYLDIPVQHSHPEILRAMRRADSIEAVADLAPRLRRHLPGITLRTTCLVGFPGETEAHFQHLLNYTREAAFDHLGVFPYSSEAGTAAHGLLPAVPAQVAEARQRRLMQAQQALVSRKLQQRVGTSDEILLEKNLSAEDNIWVGRSRREAPQIDNVVFITGLPGQARPGDFINVEYTDVDGYDMWAEPLEQEM